MINVLHLIDTTGPGGAETVFTELLSRLPGEQYRHYVLLRGKGWVADRVDAIGIRPELLDSKGSFNLGYLYQLVRIIRRHRIRLIHAHLLGSNVYGALAALVTRTPLIATFHGNVDVAARERFLDTKFRIVSLGARSIVCVSNGLKEALQRRSALDTQKLRVIYNGVEETPPTSEAKGGPGRAVLSDLGLPAETRLAISVGNIRPAKGYQYLIDAAALVRNSAWHFLVIGQPKANLMDELNARVQRLGVADRVHFLGFREDARGLLAQADVFLLPSISEGFSIATVEAMMAGVPVIATRSGGPEEIIEHERTGLLIPPENPQAIADALAWMESGVHRDKLIPAARDVARAKFSMDVMIHQYEALYAKLAG